VQLLEIPCLSLLSSKKKTLIGCDHLKNNN
jgi:hypothetical protein